MAQRIPTPHAMVALIFTTALSAGSVAWAIDGTMRAPDEDMGVYVTVHAGAVDVRTAGARQRIRVGSAVALPARIVTGADGSLGLRQQNTSIAIAADSDVELPEIAAQGQLVARLIQHRGNVFYDVESRPANKLNVETPFLVAVVKGTQFNVAVDGEQTMIALFEGALELRSPDGAQRIDLNAGEIAIRAREDATIRVLSMDAVVQREGLPSAADGPAPGTAADADQLGLPGEPTLVRGALDGLANIGSAERVAADGIATALELSAGADAGIGVSASLSSGSADLGVGASVNLSAGSTGLALDVGADLGAGSTGLPLDVGADLGAAGTLDLGLDGSLDLGAPLTTEPLLDPTGGGALDPAPVVDPDAGGGLLPLVPAL